MRSHIYRPIVPFLVRGAIVALLVMIAGGVLSGPAGLGPEPHSAEATGPLIEVKILTGSDGQAFDQFGFSVAVSGDTAVVGAFADDAGGDVAGAAYLFERNEGGPDNWGEVTMLASSDLQAGGSFGFSVAVNGDTAIVGARGEDAGATSAGAAYVFERNQGGADNWGEVKKLTASDGQAFDRFGESVAVSGDTAVVGAFTEDAGGSNAGAAYVFERDQGGADNWGEVKKLTASDAEAFDQFGSSVAISGDSAVVGAPREDAGGGKAGAAYVFQRDQGGTGNWGEVKKLLASDAQAGDRFGGSVAIGGNTAIVGARGEDAGGSSAGAAYVFQRNQGGPNNWGEVKKLLASDGQADDFFGFSVAISGETAVAGATAENGSNAGAAYVFERSQGGADNWGEVTKLASSDLQPGDQFGNSVAVSGDTAVVGAWGEDDGGLNAGAAYVFERNQGGAGNWGEVKKLTASDGQADGFFGFSVAISGETAVVGAHVENGSAGAAYVFQRDQGGADRWGEVKKLTASDAGAGDLFGWSVAISGDTAVVGATVEDAGGSQAGAAYVFQRDQGGADNWGEVKKLTASDGQTGDLFGSSVAISGDVAVAGATGKPGAAGAAYVFHRDQGGAGNWGEVKKLVASDAEAFDQFGGSVAVSGNTAVVGARFEDAGVLDAGAAYVFERSQGGPDNWGEVKKLTASDGQADDQFGFSVAVSGDTAVVGANGEDAGGDVAGAAYVFERDQGGANNWGEVTKLTASDAEAGDRLGFSMAVSGDTAVAGAVAEGSAGAAYVFQRDQGGAGNWGEVQKLTASDAHAIDQFGFSVAVSGGTAVIGADSEDTGDGNTGAAYVFAPAVVGGVAELPEVAKTPLETDGSSGPSAGLLAGAIVGAVLVGGVTLGGAAWYARRRL